MTTDAGSRLGELVKQALDAASVLEDEDRDLQRIAFERVLDHLLGNGGAQQQHAATAAAEAAPTTEPIDSVLDTEQQRLDAAARYFGFNETEPVRELFDLSGDEPKLVFHANKLPEGKAAAVRNITLLVCGVRTAVGLETGTQHIRQAADTYKKLDAANFMTTLGSMDEIAVLGKPRSPNRLVRMRGIGAEAARPLAQKLVA